jgi:hypothetical protein
MDATKKRAEKLQAKGKTVDFKELVRTENSNPDVMMVKPTEDWV